MSDRVMQGLRELSGIVLCEVCGRALKNDQGKTTVVGDRQIRTCFGLCARWAADELARSSLA